MDDSQTETKIFSVRIVTIDYYMASPIPEVDISYSSFQGGKVYEVPVIRVYGSTPAGQKACVHIHGALPYLYVPVSEIPNQASPNGDAYKNGICLAIEKALKLKGTTGSKRKHVHGCNLVRAKRLYGYHTQEELFLKIYLYYPQDVSRAANLLLAGAVLERSIQPHESHIPFLLQFLVDYNLYGMGHLHLAKMKFRFPVPNNLTSSQAKSPKYLTAASDIQEESNSVSLSSSHIWHESTIPDGWIWPPCSDFATSSDQGTYQVKRQSTCQLEADTIVDDILNQQCKMYTSFSQTEADVKMVQSLVPIWQEEYERNGTHEEKPLPDPGKPQPNFVLKALSGGLDYEHKIHELCNRLEEALSPFSEKDGSAVLRMGSESTDGQSLRSFSLLEDKTSRKGDERPTGGAGELMEVAEEEAMALLKWLASSQAARDSNSDDELIQETVLSPLLPAATMNKVIEKANCSYEDESQKECQDILDSVEDLTDLQGQKLKAPTENSEYVVGSFSLQKVPQVDGAGDDRNRTISVNLSNEELNVESTRSPGHMLQDADSGSKSKQKRKRSVWAPLPFAVGYKKNLNTADQREEHEASVTGFQEEAKTSLLAYHEHKSSFDHASNSAHVGFQEQDSKTLLGCSVRDLMRKKRSYRSELAECTGSGSKNVSIEKEITSCPGKLEFPTGRSDVEILQTTESEDEFHLRSDFSPLQTRFHAATGSPGLCTEHPDVHTDTIPFINEDQLVPPVSESSFHASTSNDRLSKIPHGVGCSNIPASIASMPENVEVKEQVEYISMSFHRKPPTGTQMNLPFENSRSPIISDHISIGGDGNCRPVQGSLYEFFPFSAEGFQQEVDFPEKLTDTKQLSTKMAMGVPVHYQNDGSYSYLLTPATSPPSIDSVCSWLSSENAGPKVLPDLPNGKPFPGSDVASSLNDQGNRSNSSAQEHVMRADMLVALRDERTPLKENGTTKATEDNSQISGIGVLSKSTPLSQIGFRDPANFGAGQQLTLFSIEVQAESRGDLRPHPQFDGINIISLAIQHDSSSMVEVHLLIRDVNESYEGHLDGISGCEVKVFSEERHLLDHFVKITGSFDPDILMGWDVQGSSLGFLAERASQLGVNLLDKVSRTPLSINTDDGDFQTLEEVNENQVTSQSANSDAVVLEDAIIEDEWGRTHASGVRVGGRIVLNVWRLMRGEVKLNMYTVEAVSEAVLRQKVPSIHGRVLNKWFSSGPGRARHRCIDYMARRAKLNLDIVNQLDMINRTSELARVFGIDFFSVLSRGSQYRVESMLMRLAHMQNYVAISPGYQQVASQPAMECLPLVMEPESGFYADPVVVLDFQSLYPSMVIAYNLCFCTCLGKVVPSKADTLGVSKYCPDLQIIKGLNEDIFLTPNGVMYVPPKIRKGVLPRLLEEILSTRIMVKKAMKKLLSSQQILQRIYNARQLALKLIANVTYGYTAAGFSGRMPCAELADSIVQCGRRTLETAISSVNAHEKWNGKVIYGDTDSMFVLLKGRTWKEAFVIGQEIASTITAVNPDPVTLKMEKVYEGCFLLTKKRYVGYSYESLDQVEPIFDAKGIETVRRDTCGVVAKMMERSLRTYFEHQEISKVREYVYRQWSRILSGRVSVQDFVFAKEVRLGTYSERASSLPPAAIVAMKAMRADPRAEPRYAERIPYVVIHGEPGARLVDLVVDPHDLLAVGSPHRLNDLYYIKKQIIPALQRAFGLVGADLSRWFSEMPRPIRDAPSKHTASSSSHRKRIDYYYYSKHCVLCGELMQAGSHLCARCLQKEDASIAAVIGKTSKLERDIQHLAAICRHCGGGDWLIDSGVKCTSLACSVYYERRKVQKELQALSSIANEAKLYPKCTVEWF